MPEFVLQPPGVEICEHYEIVFATALLFINETQDVDMPFRRAVSGVSINQRDQSSSVVTMTTIVEK